VYFIDDCFIFLDNGKLYVWGSGSEGQLGLGIAECELPSELKFRSKVTSVACGYYHTAVITGNSLNVVSLEHCTCKHIDLSYEKHNNYFVY
jgi:hypothetical protein